jgi:hypothetical protein
MNNWELYEDHPRFKEATAAIDAAWVEAKQLAPREPTRERVQIAAQHMYAVLNKYREVGACDTEPRWAVKDAIRQHFGCDDWDF